MNQQPLLDRAVKIRYIVETGVPMNRPTAAIVLAITVCAGCASREGTVPRPFPRPGGWTPSSTAASRPIPADGTGIAETALALQGRPYRDGGDSPAGFDCSGFTSYVFATHGIILPRRAADQYLAGTAVGREELVPGDLVFFETVAPGASHVGVAIGDLEFIHAPSSRGEVRVEQLDSRYWAERYVGAKRIVKR